MEQNQNEPSLEEQIKALQEALEAAQNTPPSESSYRGSALQVRDLSGMAAKYLTPDATVICAITSKSQLHQYNEPVEVKKEGATLDVDMYVRKVAPAVFYTVIVRKDRVADGVEAIAKVINQLVEMGAVTSVLAPMSSIDLAEQACQAQTSAVFCFPHIRPEFLDQARNMPHFTLEGGLGSELHDLSADLAPGEFLAEVRIAHQLTMIQKTTNEAQLHNMIEGYLQILPKGTKFLGYRQCAIADLSIPYELKFFHPYFKDIRQVELDYVRSIVELDPKEVAEHGSTIAQFNLLTGVRYLRKHHLSDKYEWFPKYGAQ